MADEARRKIKRKKIKLPGGATVNIPVISQIAFLDASERGWETQYTLDNTTDADRNVHVAIVKGDGTSDESGSGDPSTGLQVERIDRFRLLDTAERGWETFPEPDSKTVAQPPDAPPYFTTHAKTHIIKYVNMPDDGNWIKSELIDAISFIDAPDRGQEAQFTLSNPPDNQTIDGLIIGTDPDDSSKTTIAIDPSASVDEITSGVGGSDEGDEPVRTDPFQNIVGFGHTHVVAITWQMFPIVDFGPPRATTGMGPPSALPESTPDFSYSDIPIGDASGTTPPARPDGVVSEPPWILSIANGGKDLFFTGGPTFSKSVPLFDGIYKIDGSFASASITGTTVQITDTNGIHTYHCYATSIYFQAAQIGNAQWLGSIFVTAWYEPGT